MMRTSVASTSIDTYRALHSEGKLNRQQSQIMGVIDAGLDYSLQELVKLTGMAINAVSGRCNELRTARRLVHGSTRRCSVTGRTVHPVRLPSIQGALF